MTLVPSLLSSALISSTVPVSVTSQLSLSEMTTLVPPASMCSTP